VGSQSDAGDRHVSAVGNPEARGQLWTERVDRGSPASREARGELPGVVGRLEVDFDCTIKETFCSA
jgi:hypothetical protein